MPWRYDVWSEPLMRERYAPAPDWRRGEVNMPERVRVRVRRGTFEVEAEGPEEFVDQRVKEEMAQWPAGGVVDDGAEISGGTGTGKRLKEFATAKKPDGHQEIAAVLAYWARANEKVAALNGEELEELYKRAEMKRPADATNMMAKAASQRGWFRNAGDGRYELTSTGEDHVIHDLPAAK